MANLQDIKQLDTEHNCYKNHLDIKLLLSDEEANLLYVYGFVDASYSCDEVPSYYLPKTFQDSGCVLHLIDDIDADHNRVSDKLTFGVCDSEWFEFDSLEDAIAKYIERVKN